MTKVGAAGLVTAIVGVLGLPIGVMLVMASDAPMPSALLPLAPIGVLLLGGGALAVFGRRRRRR